MIYTFFGVDHKVGTTMIAQSVAETLIRSNPEYRIALFALNGRKSLEFTRFKDTIPHVEFFKENIDNKTLTADFIKKNVPKHNNIHHIGGLSEFIEERNYNPNDVDTLLRVANEAFDIIIVDGGASLDSPFGLGSLMFSDKQFLVLKQSECSIRRYEELRPYFKQLNITFMKYIINKYLPTDELDIKHINREIDLPLNMMLKVESSKSGRKAEIEEKTLLSYRDSKFPLSIQDIVKEIMSVHSGQKRG